MFGPSFAASPAATMASADFCLVTPRIAARRAMPVVPFAAVFARCAAGSRRDARVLVIQFHPVWKLRFNSTSHAGQISPGKNAMFPCTSAAFTVVTVPMGFAVMCQLARRPQPSMQFLSVASHVCARASSRQALAALPLPSASGYHRFMLNPCRHSHRGLPPHYIAPMLGAHPSLHPTLPAGFAVCRPRVSSNVGHTRLISHD